MPNVQYIQELIGKNIRYFRKKRGMTQLELTQAFQLNLRHFQDIERGKVDLKLSTLAKLSLALNVSFNELLKDGNGVLEGLDESLELNDQKVYLETFKLLNNSNSPLQICDQNGLIRYSNRAHANLTLYEASEICNRMYIWELGDEGVQEEIKKYIKYLVTNRPKPIPYYTHNRTKNGFVPVKVYWDYILDRNKALLGFVCYIKKRNCHCDVCLSKELCSGQML